MKKHPIVTPLNRETSTEYLGLRVPRSVWQQIESLRDSTGRSRSDVVLLLLRDALARQAEAS